MSGSPGGPHGDPSPRGGEDSPGEVRESPRSPGGGDVRGAPGSGVSPGMSGVPRGKGEGRVPRGVCRGGSPGGPTGIRGVPPEVGGGVGVVRGRRGAPPVGPPVGAGVPRVSSGDPVGEGRVPGWGDSAVAGPMLCPQNSVNFIKFLCLGEDAVRNPQFRPTFFVRIANGLIVGYLSKFLSHLPQIPPNPSKF